MEKTIFTHSEYAARKCSHRTYWAQFADIFTHSVTMRFGKAFLSEKLAEDKHLNNIPLREWDLLAKLYAAKISKRNLAINGFQGWSISDGVCAAKEAAIQIVEGK